MSAGGFAVQGSVFRLQGRSLGIGLHGFGFVSFGVQDLGSKGPQHRSSIRSAWPY